MKIDVRSNESLYVELNGWVYYIDDSTDEQIIKKWKNKYTQKEYQMLIQGMILAVTAPTDEQSDKCIKIVEELSILFPKNIIEKAKKEVEFYINN